MPHPLLALLLAVQSAGPTAPSADLRGEPLMAALKQGGYTVVLRHARTDRSYQEAMGTIPPSRALQRNLNDDGVRDARLMGQVLKKYAIPFSEVLSSPMYRTMETAEYAVGPATPTMVLRTFPTSEEQRQLLAVVPPPGTNRLLVTHHFVLETHIPGIAPGDIGESEAAVIRTAADGRIELVGRILLADWQALAGVTPGPAATSASAAPQGHGAPPPAAAALHPAGPVTWPDTPVARLAQAYLRAFSSGDTARMREFAETSLVTDPTRTVADRLASFARLYADLGPLRVIALDATAPGTLQLLVQARSGAAQLTVLESAQQPGRAASITLRYERPRP